MLLITKIFLFVICRIYFRYLNKIILHRNPVCYDGPTLFYSNHRSYLDGAIIAGEVFFRIYGLRLFINHPYIPVAGEHFETSIRKFVMRAIRAFPVSANPHKNATALRQLYNRLQEGEKVLIFPEGQVSENFNGFMGGIGKLALANTKTIVVPIWIENSEELSSIRSSKVIKFLIGLKFFKTIRIHIGNSIKTAEFSGRSREEITKILEAKLLELQPKPAN